MEIASLSYVLPARIYINWKVDRLCVMDHSCIPRPVEYSGTSFADLCCKKGLHVLALNLSNSHLLDPLSKVFGLSLRKMGLKELILFCDESYKHHAKFRFEPFQMTNKDGRLSTVIKAPLTLLGLTVERDKILATWDEIEADVAKDQEKDSERGEDIDLPPRPEITLRRFLFPRGQQG
ncbi:hypothetical protein EG329_012370 [Mollisiaceae sp. DMI_Dod_QoI]|nr:hypothetical protein EG329_012370 [Helotiales sp. DMI_Dod_QoI]